jgi:hypothetical protein
MDCLASIFQGCAVRVDHVQVATFLWANWLMNGPNDSGINHLSLDGKEGLQGRIVGESALDVDFQG